MSDTLTQKTLAEFVAAHQITMTCTQADGNPNMDDSANMDHWKCTLVRPDGELRRVRYACRDTGDRFEHGTLLGEWGESDENGKRTFFVHRGLSAAAHYFFPDEVKSDKPVARVAKMTLTFSQGYGHNGAEPKVTSVLSCLASDASGDQHSFEDWCAEYGYDTDSRKAEKTFKAVRHQTARLKAFLGAAFDEMVYGTEAE